METFFVFIYENYVDYYREVMNVEEVFNWR